jgi:AbrB family looped-hinge helix DNA binding protein
MKAAVSTISPEGQVTIPTEIREHLGLDAADEVAFVIGEQGKVELRSVSQALEALEAVFGSVPALPAWETSGFEDQIQDSVKVRPARLSLSQVRGVVPALPGRETIDFDDQIQEAQEEEAERIVAGMGGL